LRKENEIVVLQGMFHNQNIQYFPEPSRAIMGLSVLRKSEVVVKKGGNYDY
jgi:hypothetical protein